MPTPTPNTLIDGRYKVLSKLGSGGMADVFLAQDEQLSRKVALKLLHERFAADPDFVERFRRPAGAGPDPAMVHRLRADSGPEGRDRGHGRALAGRLRRDRRRSDRQGCRSNAAGRGSVVVPVLPQTAFER